jgi:NAD kinase
MQISDTFFETLNKSNMFKNVNMISEIDVTPKDTKDVDVCITIGGDNTFLKTAGCIHDSQTTSIVGVNSHPIIQKGKLCEMNMEFDQHKK